MQTISLNESFMVRFITNAKDYENDLVILRRLKFTCEFEDLTKENCPPGYPMREGTNEVIFRIPVKDFNEAAFLRVALQRTEKI